MRRPGKEKPTQLMDAQRRLWFEFKVYDQRGGEPYDVCARDIYALLDSVPRVVAVSVFHPIRKQWEDVDVYSILMERDGQPRAPMADPPADGGPWDSMCSPA